MGRAPPVARIVASRRARRVLGAAVVAALGIVVCLANDRYWQAKLPSAPTFESVAGDLELVAFPFYVLALVVAAWRVRVPVAALCFVALTLLTMYEFHWDHTTDSSTAALAYVGSLTLGVPLVVAAVLLDELVRWLQEGRRDSLHPGR